MYAYISYNLRFFFDLLLEVEFFFFKFFLIITSRRITGLDPAAPLYLKWSYDAIRKTDAPFVDIIHTNGERLGEAWAR